MKLLNSLLYLAFSVVFSLSSSMSRSPELDHVTVMSSSGEELQSAMGEELESEGASGLFTAPPLLRVSPGGWEESRGRGGRRRQGGRRRSRGHVTVGQQLTFSTPDPCRTTHSDYCIHGHCTYLQDLHEPVCVCMKGYDGVRCGIQLMQTSSGSGSDRLDDQSHTHTHTHTLQLILVIIAVVLSIISCSAIIIIITVQYKAQHSFQAAFLSSNSEKEKLQKSPSA
ncbi:proheparin-binding EGF-like growth factor [Astyanax mexicanus]|uniref:proheparin-binding EGF-like growth factor n=1 Tax=Astyanax mexicanus TaxID=7994 RepID=UPI0020CB0A5F|nr:proheparin-binding EGF-like growth factor [Astyanax mexicanus]